jgi:hypothetical protein
MISVDLVSIGLSLSSSDDNKDIYYLVILVMRLFWIRNATVSNLGRAIGYPDWNLRNFPQSYCEGISANLVRWIEQYALYVYFFGKRKGYQFWGAVMGK